MATSVEPKRDKQVRFRVYATEDEHLRRAAKDAGFEDKSAYLRDVLLAKHVVVVKGQGIVLIPAAAASEENQQAVADLLTEVLEALTAQESSQAAGSTASEPPDPAPALTGAGGAPAGDDEGIEEDAYGLSGGADTAPSSSPETSPGEGDGLLGASSHEPPAGSSDVATSEDVATSSDVATESAAGSIPGPEKTTPEPTAQELVDEMPGGVAVFGPEVQPGETQLAYLERRTTELKFQGRPVILARYEAEAEYRRYAAMAISGSLPSQAIEQPTPGPTSCSQCGTVKRSPGPCPDCGAPA